MAGKPPGKWRTVFFTDDFMDLARALINSDSIVLDDILSGPSLAASRHPEKPGCHPIEGTRFLYVHLAAPSGRFRLLFTIDNDDSRTFRFLDKADEPEA